METIFNPQEFLPIVDLISNAERNHQSGTLTIEMRIPIGLDYDTDKILCFFREDACITYSGRPIIMTFKGTIKDKVVSDFVEIELERKVSRTVIINE